MPPAPFFMEVTRLLSVLLVLFLFSASSMFSDKDLIPPDDKSYTVGPHLAHRPVIEMETILACVLHDFRLPFAGFFLPEDLDWWVLPRSTTWFNKFVMFEFDDKRWVKKFCMLKNVILKFSNLLAPHVQKHDTRYCRVVLVIVRVCYTLYKLTQGASLVQCSKCFGVGVTTVSEMLRE